VAKDLRQWLAATGAKTLYIEPGSPWENGSCKSFNSKLREEFLNGEIFYSIKELRVLAERWRTHYNTVRPHPSLGYRPPAPETWQPELKPSTAARYSQNSLRYTNSSLVQKTGQARLVRSALIPGVAWRISMPVLSTLILASLTGIPNIVTALQLPD